MSKRAMKLCFSPEEDDKLVEAISPHPVLYDLSHPLSKDQRAKVSVWEMISEQVGRSVADCKKRWRNIKDTHDRRIRENNKTGSGGPACKKGKTWHLQEQLSFLHTAAVKRQSFSNEHNEESVSEEQDDSVGLNASETEQEQDTAAAAAPAPVVSPQPLPPRQVFPNEILTKNRPKKTTYRERSSLASEKRSRERDTMVNNLLEKDEETDDISLFFKSIAKSVQKMPPNLQRRAKLETLTLISNIESDMWASLHGTCGTIMVSSPSTSARSDVSVTIDCTPL